MKCDELKAYRNIDVAFNTARQTDTVIAEDYEGYCIEFEEDDEVYLKDEVDAVIAEKDRALEFAKALTDSMYWYGIHIERMSGYEDSEVR